VCRKFATQEKQTQLLRTQVFVTQNLLTGSMTAGPAAINTPGSFKGKRVKSGSFEEDLRSAPSAPAGKWPELIIKS
jgi:hypothetical protein